MSDSVDRVFSHALNTVNKIRTGSEKPPAATRLKLYGLYKQSMEGDVEGIMERPTGTDESSKRAQEKWDAWHSCTGLSRTEAKRRYITTLLDTMHKYASPSPDARELVSELEFVWDQVKSNVPSSSSSSPVHTLAMPAGFSSVDTTRPPPSFPRLGSASPTSEERGRERRRPADTGEEKDGLRVMSPMSQSQEEDAEAEEDAAEAEGGEIFVDARDSQIAEPPPRHDDLSHQGSQEDKENQPPDSSAALTRPNGPKRSPDYSPRNPRWKYRVESALVRLTAEVAALREQLESRRLLTFSKKHRMWQWVLWAVWGLVKHIAVDFLVLAVVLLWLRRKNDRRLEGAIRVLLGDAVAEVRRIQHAVVGGKHGK